MRFEQVQRFILAKKIFWGEGHFKLIIHMQYTVLNDLKIYSNDLKTALHTLVIDPFWIYRYENLYDY